jgi:hypothetical protein
MILRRITQHVRERNWTAIAIDFVIGRLRRVHRHPGLELERDAG